MTVLLRQVMFLQLEVAWVGSYLCCKVEDVPLYEESARMMIRQAPDSSFTKNLKIICRDTGVNFSDLLS